MDNEITTDNLEPEIIQQEKNSNEEILQEIKSLNENFVKFNNYLLEKDKIEKLDLSEKEQKNLLIEKDTNLKIVEQEQSEIDFRNGVLDSLTYLNSVATNLNEKSFQITNDELSNLSSINSNLAIISEPVSFTEEEQANIHISNFANLGIVIAVFIGIPVVVLWKMFSKLLYQLV